MRKCIVWIVLIHITAILNILIALISRDVVAIVIINLCTAAVMIRFRERIRAQWHELTGQKSLYAYDVEMSTSESPGGNIDFANPYRQTQKYERKVAKYTRKLAVAQNMLHDLRDQADNVKEKSDERLSDVDSAVNVTFETVETGEKICNDIGTM